MNLFDILLHLEGDDSLHMSRLLVLLKVFAGRNGSGTVEGITKLAKLDFLLRYPVWLKKSLIARGQTLKTAAADVGKVAVKTYEMHSVESAMVRYRYGPWDFRYRRFLNLLVSKGLVWVKIEGRTINIGLTEKGFDTAKQLQQDSAFKDLNARASIIKRNFNINGTALMKFIYATFPELSSMRFGEKIKS